MEFKRMEQLMLLAVAIIALTAQFGFVILFLGIVIVAIVLFVRIMAFGMSDGRPPVEDYDDY